MMHEVAQKLASIKITCCGNKLVISVPLLHVHPAFCARQIKLGAGAGRCDENVYFFALADGDANHPARHTKMDLAIRQYAMYNNFFPKNCSVSRIKKTILRVTAGLPRG